MLQEFLVANIPKETYLYNMYVLLKKISARERRKVIIVFFVIESLYLCFLAKMFGIRSFLNGLIGPTAIFTYIVFIITNILLIAFLSKSRKLNALIDIDETTGKMIVETGSGVQSKFMSNSEIRKSLNVTSIENTKEQIYGQLVGSKVGTEVVSEKPNPSGAVESQNTVMFAPPGKGKSSTAALPNIFQSLVGGKSFFATDPKGELREKTIHIADKEYGYDTWTLNTKDPKYSDCWDCLQEVVDTKTGKLDDTRLNTWVYIFFNNTKKGSAESEYFRNGSENLMIFIVGCMFWKKEKYITDMYFRLYQQLGGNDYYFNTSMDITEMERIIYELSEKNNFSHEEIENLMKEINDNAPTATIDDLCYWERHFDRLVSYVDIIPQDHPAISAWYDFKEEYTAQSNVWRSFKSGLSHRLKIFNDSNLRVMLSNKGIDLHKFNRDKTGIYMVIKPTDTMYKAIASLFVTFLIMDIEEEWDMMEAKNKEVIQNGKPEDVKKQLSVNMIVDEMFAIGALGGKSEKGDPGWLAAQLATTRSYFINMLLIFQGWPQVKQIYNDDDAYNILNCCPNLIFLGGYDPETLDFLSRYTGETTTMTESRQVTDTLFGAKESKTANVGSTKAYLLTANDVRKTPKYQAILIHGIDDPIRLQSFYYMDHPLAKHIVELPIANDITQIRDRIAEGSIRPSAFNIQNYGNESEFAKEGLLASIKKLKPINVYESLDTVICDDKNQETELEDTQEIPVVQEIYSITDLIKKKPKMNEKKAEKSVKKNLKAEQVSLFENEKFVESSVKTQNKSKSKKKAKERELDI